MKQETIPTNQGNLTIAQIMDSLMWSSYKGNRDAGVTHELLISYGIGNEEMKKRYESKFN